MRGGCGANDAGEEADTGVNQGHGRQLAAGQDIVANRDFAQVAGFDDALVDTFEAAGQQNDTGASGQFLDDGLVERVSARAQIDGRQVFATQAGVVDGGGGNVAADDHAGAAAGRRIIDGMMGAKTEIAQSNGVE